MYQLSSRVSGFGSAGLKNLARPALCAALTLAAAYARPASAGGDFMQISPINIPNYVSAGVGMAPDYRGSDDYSVSGAPMININLGGERYGSIVGNYMEINLFDHPNFRAGPAATYRFGRDDVDDGAVDALDDIDDTIELGGFVAYVIVDPNEPRDRLRFTADITQDVGGEHDGFVAGVSVWKWFPVRSAGTLGIGAAASYGSSDYTDTYFSIDADNSAASGLNTFDADGGFRDARLGIAYVQALTPSWYVGGGVQYSRLLGDSADSPIVDKRGSPDQFIFGAGIGYAW